MNTFLRITLRTARCTLYFIIMFSLFVWIRSYYFLDRMEIIPTAVRRWFAVDSAQGNLRIRTFSDEILTSKPAFTHSQVQMTSEIEGVTHRWFSSTHLGFGMDLSPSLVLSSGTSNLKILYLPAWLPSLVAVSMLALTRKRNGKPGNRGLCMFCGYDLRATPSFCPECGAFSAITPEHNISSSFNDATASDDVGRGGVSTSMRLIKRRESAQTPSEQIERSMQ